MRALHHTWIAMALAVGGIAGCQSDPQGSAASGGPGLAMQLKLPQLPAAVQQRLQNSALPELASASQPLNQGNLSISIHRITVDLKYDDADGLPKAQGYVLPGYRIGENELEDIIHTQIKWDAATGAATISATTSFRIDDIPVDDALTMEVRVYAVNFEPALLEGKVEAIATTQGKTTIVPVTLTLTDLFDADDDGYVIPVLGGTDCNDDNDQIYEGQTETCDGIDQACNGPDDEDSLCAAACLALGMPSMQQIPTGEGYVGYEDLEDTPLRPVFVSGFCMDKFEVSVSQYKTCVDNASCSPVAITEVADLVGYPSDFTGHGSHPILGVTQPQADDYCNFVGKRLPKEFEWEIAARGFDGRQRSAPWGIPETPQTDDNTPAKVRDSNGYEPVPVDSMPGGKSPFGVRHMIGNAGEWTADFFDESRVRLLPEDSTGLPPVAPADQGLGYVVRGGGWDTALTKSLVYVRYGMDATEVNPEIGVRCVKTF